jgi:hypothetical protein
MKIFHWISFLLLASLSNCKKPESNIGTPERPAQTYQEISEAAERAGIPLSQFGIKRSWDDVLVIANQYGLLDTFKLLERKSSALLCHSEINLHEYFKAEKQYYERRHQRQIFLSRLHGIECLDQYFILLDSLPLLRAFKFPTEDKLNAFKADVYAEDRDVYINQSVDRQSKQIIPYLTLMVKGEMPTEKARLLKKRCDR